jgi:hypothetical protein
LVIETHAIAICVVSRWLVVFGVIGLYAKHSTGDSRISGGAISDEGFNRNPFGYASAQRNADAATHVDAQLDADALVYNDIQRHIHTLGH